MLDRDSQPPGQDHGRDDDPADIARDDFQRDFARVGREGDPDGHDCFAPPLEPCECYCLHCQRTFMSDGIWFQKIVGRKKNDSFDGFWMCPTPNCDGKGFTFDIFPTDPDHPANDGWSYDDDYEEDDEDFHEFDDDADAAVADDDGGDWDPTESKYAALDEQLGDAEDDIIEGDEWKLGPEESGRPRAPLGWSAEARREWEEEQRRYDGPDERPREVDWSDRPEIESIDDDDIPF